MDRSDALWRYDLRVYKALLRENRGELVLRMAALNVTGLFAGVFFADTIYFWLLAAYNATQLGLYGVVRMVPDRASRLQTAAVFGTVAAIFAIVMGAAVYLWIHEGTEGKVLGLLLVVATMLYTVSQLRYEPVACRIECGAIVVACLVLIGVTVATEDMGSSSLSMVIELAALTLYYLRAALSVIATQERLRASQRAEVHRARMEAIGQLSGGVAHDFNNLLTIIKGNLELRRAIQLQGGSLLEAEQLIRAAENATERAERTARHLLAVSRRGEATPVSFRLAEALEETVPLLRASLPANIALKVDVGPETARVRCDLSQLENVVLNLVINARDAMPEGGTVRVEVSEGREGVRLDVTDTGTGMTPEVLDRACEPFFSTKPKGQGSGLGLSMARAFAEEAGGSMAIDSAPGTSTRIRLVLPDGSRPVGQGAASPGTSVALRETREAQRGGSSGPAPVAAEAAAARPVRTRPLPVDAGDVDSGTRAGPSDAPRAGADAVQPTMPGGTAAGGAPSETAARIRVLPRPGDPPDAPPRPRKDV